MLSHDTVIVLPLLDSIDPMVRSVLPSVHFSSSITLPMSFTSPEQTWASATSAAFPDATDRATALPSVSPAQVPSSAEASAAEPLSPPSPESLPPPVVDACPPVASLPESLFPLSLPQPVRVTAATRPATRTAPVRTSFCT